MKIRQLGFSIVFFFIVNNLIYGQVNFETTVTNEVNSSAIGKSTQANGQASFASGAFSIADGDGSTTLGFRNLSGDIYTTTIGSFLKAKESHAMVIGDGYGLNNELINNNDYSLMIGFNSNLPSFYISKSIGVNSTGKIAIGNVVNSFGKMDPQAKLHIRSDEGEEAAIFIEPIRWSESAQASLYIGNRDYGITSHGSAGLVFRTQSAYIFNDGNIGIGIVDGHPETKLDVAGTVKMKGFRLFNQSAEVGSVLMCSGINGEATWRTAEDFSVWSINEENEAFRMSNVGIGIENPKEKLEVNGNIIVSDAIVGREGSKANGWYDIDFLTLKGSENEYAGKIMLCKGLCGEKNPLKIINPIGEIQFSSSGKIMFSLRESEAVFGRPDEEEYKLKINGKIWSHEVEVRVLDWWDDVFETDYNLIPLSELEKYIKLNNHLPDIPTEENVLKNGIELGEMNALLLKKIEELTLYIIEQQKRLDVLEKRIIQQD